jgi:hypothetical protein
MNWKSVTSTKRRVPAKGEVLRTGRKRILDIKQANLRIIKLPTSAGDVLQDKSSVSSASLHIGMRRGAKWGWAGGGRCEGFTHFSPF